MNTNHAREHFPMLELATSLKLERGGYRSIDSVADATDEELLAVRMVGPKRVAVIRALIPARNQRLQCPQCGGLGYIRAPIGKMPLEPILSDDGLMIGALLPGRHHDPSH